MNFKNLFGAFAIAAAGMLATASNAAVTYTVNGGADTSSAVSRTSFLGIANLEIDVDEAGAQSFTTFFVNDSFENFTIEANTIFSNNFDTALVEVTSGGGTIFGPSAPDFEDQTFFIAAGDTFEVTLSYLDLTVPTDSKGDPLLQSFDVTLVSQIPVPAGLVLLLTGLGGLAFVGRRRRALAA